jgi:hypothetical protein
VRQDSKDPPLGTGRGGSSSTAETPPVAQNRWQWLGLAAGSLYAHLRRNTDDPAKPPGIQIEPDDYTSAITFAITLAQHIAMVADCSPWRALMALHDAAGLNDEDDGPAGIERGTVVTMSEGYSLPEWPYKP